MGAYLYIIPFKNKEYFKFGVSFVENFNRVDKHIKTYDGDENNITIVESMESSIKLLEKNIATIIPISEKSPYGNTYDGYTEIRGIKHIDKAMSIINMFKDDLSLNIKQYKPNKITKINKKLKPKTKPVNNHLSFNYNYSKLSKFFYNIKKYRSNIINVDTEPSYPLNNEYVTFTFNLSDKTDNEINVIGDKLSIDFKCGCVFQWLSSRVVITRDKTLQISFYKKCPKYGENDNHLTYSNLEHLYNKFMENFINLTKKDLELS